MLMNFSPSNPDTLRAPCQIQSLLNAKEGREVVFENKSKISRSAPTQIYGSQEKDLQESRDDSSSIPINLKTLLRLKRVPSTHETDLSQ